MVEVKWSKIMLVYFVSPQIDRPVKIVSDNDV